MHLACESQMHAFLLSTLISFFFVFVIVPLTDYLDTLVCTLMHLWHQNVSLP